MSKPITVLCLSSAVKGQRLIQELKRLGCRVFLLTEERWRDDEWPYESLEGIHYMHSLANRQHVINAASYMARGLQFDLIIPLDEYEVQTAGALREHFIMPGMTASEAQPFNDKLAMRARARSAGIPTPEFTPVFNYDALRAWMARVPPPWLLKPRHEAGAMGIKRCEDAEQVWRWLDRLGDEQSRRLLEQFVPSDVFHVDALVWQGQVVFTIAGAYGEPPLSVSHGGGVFITRTLPAESDAAQTLAALNAQVIGALAPRGFSGAVHAEYLRALDTGRWLFLEAGARVGGANIADMIEYATGVNLWAEWARIEVARFLGEGYAPPAARRDHAGVLVCLARQEHPDLSGYNDPEVVWRLKKRHHAGLIVVSPDAARVQSLLSSYSRRFAEDFLARAEPWETGRMV
ncbi:MAG: acetyl-CoA carboxylase biotin carboxylase subunit family protein [Thermoflexales bacterium]